MLKDQVNFSKVYLVTGHTDLRRGIPGLSTLVRYKFGLDPLENGTLFLFCGRSCKTIKGLVWDDTGYILLTKTLSCGRYQWPRSAEEAKLLTKKQFDQLAEGLAIDVNFRSFGKKFCRSFYSPGC